MSKPRWTSLKIWLFENHKTTSSQTHTHFLLDGGVINVPDEQMNKFYEKLAYDIDIGDRNFLVEVRTAYFKYFVDIDMQIGEQENKSNAMMDCVIVIRNVVKEFFPSEDGFLHKMILCERPPDKLKLGAHLIFPNLPVKPKTALILREAIIQKANEILGKRTESSWDRVIDASVYKGYGLRMVGCPKLVPCTNCNGKTEGCSMRNCIRGKQDVGRIYKPTRVWDKEGDEILFRMLNDSQFMVKQTTIRTNIVAATAPKLGRYPEWFQIQTPIPTQKKRARPEEDSDQAKIEAIDQLVSALFPQNATGANSIQKLTHDKNLTYYIATSSSRFCINKEGEHRTNHIYFMITKGGIRQMCYCKCEEERKYTTCSNFRSELIPFKKMKGWSYVHFLLFGDGSVSDTKFMEIPQTTDEKKNIKKGKYWGDEEDNLILHLINTINKSA